ncbi:hypothetical protein [Nocardia africana]
MIWLDRLRGKRTHRIDVTLVPPGTLERMAASDAQPSPVLRTAIERARQRRGDTE